jgi:hypothetical protein
MVPILGTPSRVSEILRGKKGLSMAMVQSLRARFRVPADLLLPPPKKAPFRVRPNGLPPDAGVILWRSIAPPDRRIRRLLIYGCLRPDVGCGWAHPHLLDDGLSVLSQGVVRGVSGDDQDAA